MELKMNVSYETLAALAQFLCSEENILPSKQFTSCPVFASLEGVSNDGSELCATIVCQDWHRPRGVEQAEPVPGKYLSGLLMALGLFPPGESDPSQ